MEDLLRQYTAVLVGLHEHRLEQGGKPRKWNRLVNRMQGLHLQLREPEECRDAITSLAIKPPNITAQSWAAGHALAWDPAAVRPLLKAQAADDMSLAGLDAKMTLREFDAGRLNFTWLPKAHYCSAGWKTVAGLPHDEDAAFLTTFRSSGAQGPGW